MIFKISFTLKQQFFEINKVSRGKIYNQLGAIHKGYLIFLAHIGPTYLLISDFWPIFGHIYLSISIDILFFQTYLLTRSSDILYGRPLIRIFQQFIKNFKDN